VDAHRYGLALDEARRALDAQAVDVGRLRDRIAGLVSVGALAAAFIGGLATQDPDSKPTRALALGVAAFVVLLGVAVWTLWPRRFQFSQNADELVRWAWEGDEIADMERYLAQHMASQHRDNDQRLRVMTAGLRVGLVLLALEIILFVIDLGGR
jgi:uncharacterized membrane protein YedE/YeeE